MLWTAKMLVSSFVKRFYIIDLRWDLYISLTIRKEIGREQEKGKGKCSEGAGER